jgi:hypothetical protein
VQKDDNTYYILYVNGYSTEHDTLKEAQESLAERGRDDQAYEIVKVTEKVLQRRV